jgi:hypothetical protein
MHCRHCNAPWEFDWEYCPECHRNYGGAVYPESQTNAEATEIGRLIALITEAFRDVQLEDGTTIHEADLEGAYSEDSERLLAREKDTEASWLDVPDWKIERFTTLLFMDPKGWRFYLPAYMIWSLRNWRTTSSPTADFLIWSLGRIDEWMLERCRTLTLPQAQAVHEFVRFFCEYSGDREPRDAMQAYWHQFAPCDKED